MNVNALVTTVQLYVDTILASSSSSSEDEYVHEEETEHRVLNFLETIHLYSETDFKKNFRLNRQSAVYLIERYTNSGCYKLRRHQGGRAQVSAEVQMLSFLWFATNKTTFREVGNLFNMSVSTTQGVVGKIVNFIVETIAKECIVFPNDEEKPVVAREFAEISGFPNVLGCIDGSYIAIRKPKHKIRSTYVNRHDSLSITLQGICDANLKFLDVYTGVPSKIHDSRVLQLSFIGKELPRRCFPDYHLLGDSSYPLREHLLTPYKDCENRTEGERIYNKKFFATRVKIENAFGKLKSRFRQLLRLDFHNVEMMAKFIMACCAIHNLCIDNNDIIDDELQHTSQQPTNVDNFYEDNDTSLMQLGQSKRKTIENLFLIT